MKNNIRSAILDALLRAESGKLQKIEQKNMPAEDRSLFKEISLGVTRNKLFLDHIIDQFIKKNPTVRLRNILRMGAYELLFLDKIPHYATLFEAVELAKSKPEKNFINAVLRKISREPKKHFKKRELKTLEDFASHYSFPLWMVEKWDKLFGFKQVQEICKVSSTVSPLTFRINTIKKEALETEKQIK
ncbi:MAG TPA: transcription antitermination factor NusB, partial [Bdellovibrionota bacterium]|nr:transcription antitermination factor NusB [Bdellovibrionota bacterium]